MFQLKINIPENPSIVNKGKPGRLYRIDDEYAFMGDDEGPFQFDTMKDAQIAASMATRIMLKEFTGTMVVANTGKVVTLRIEIVEVK